MQKYKSNITSTTGAAIRNVPVTVLNEAGELASLFLDRAGAIAAPNPLVTDSSGNFYFYAVNGRYSLRTTVEGVTITDDDVVLLQDPEEITVAGPIAEAVAAAQAAARQAQDVVDSSGIPDMVAAAQNAVIDSNQALQEARGASLASAEAKLAAESAKSAAELAKGDAQAASSTANAAAQQANAAAQSAAQSAVSIDPARLLTPAERLKLDGVEAGATKVEATRISATSLQDFFAQCLAKGSGFYRADGETIPIEMRYSPGFFSKTLDTWSFMSLRWDTAKPVFYAGRFEDIPTSTWKQFVLTATAQTWTAVQSFYGGFNASRIGIGSTTWNTGVGVYCTDTTFPANGNISGVNFDISTDSTTLTAGRTHRAAYLRMRGNNTVAQLAGSTISLVGSEAVAEVSAAADGVGEATVIAGARGYATDNAARTQNLANAYAGWFISQHVGTTTKQTNDSYGVASYINNTNTNSTLVRALGSYTSITNAGTINTAYLFRGVYAGSGTYGIKWGIHLAGSTQNQIDGWLNLTDTTESTSATTGALRIAGGLGVAKNLVVGGDLGLSDAAKITIRHMAWAFGTYGGTANAITLSSVYPQTSLVRGQIKTFRATAANTGATTINVDGLGAVGAVTVTGVALPAGYIRTDVDTVATYNGTNWVVDRQVQYGSNANGTFILRNDGSLTILVTPNATVTSVAANTPVVYSGYATPTPVVLSKSSVVFAQINPGTSPDFMYGYAQMAGAQAIAAVGKNGGTAQNITLTSYSVQGYWY